MTVSRTDPSRRFFRDARREHVALPDRRFDDAEDDVNVGASWQYHKPDAPNPLTLQATGWSVTNSILGEAEILDGVDRHGKPWSILIGCDALKKKLVEGLVEEWDDTRNEFVVTETIGRVEIGEVVALRYVGDIKGATCFRVSRKPVLPASGGALSGERIRFSPAVA